jgi:16S rRNA (cytidine1402-2'-O)-methyltransferase
MRGALSLNPGLYVTATPIGNLGDITYRAVECLQGADLILCEDTRRTAKLCAAYGVDTPRAAYHDHNAERRRPEIIKKLQAGAAICLVSDAGTPLISDPGYRLVCEARAAGVAVFPLPGPCAAVAALSAAGAPSDRFFFAGFPPTKEKARMGAFESLAVINATLVFYESGPRLGASLAAMAAVFGARRAVVARELTKLHEEFRQGELSALAAHYGTQPPKGEIVILVFPPAPTKAHEGDIDDFLKRRLERHSVKEAAALAAAAFGVSRNIAYARALALKDPS